MDNKQKCIYKKNIYTTFGIFFSLPMTVIGILVLIFISTQYIKNQTINPTKFILKNSVWHLWQEIPDAQRIRRTILSNCEKALSPTLSSEENQRLLHTVIVGGGPTGVEFGAELYDFKVKVSPIEWWYVWGCS